jgi:hypothetical protein
MLETLQEALAIVQALPATTPCRLCDYWQSDACSRWGAVPPADVQAAGCDEWVDEIPF